MATAAENVMRKRVKIRRRQQQQLVVVYGGKELDREAGNALLAGLSERLRCRDEQVRSLARRPAAREVASVRFAMRAVEAQIVKGLWVTELATEHDGPRNQRRHGVGYMLDNVDHWGQAVAKGGWTAPEPSPAIPSSREIDAAEEVKKWIEWLDEGQARLLRVAALTKRGERDRRVNWGFVKHRLRLPEDIPMRTLQDRYDRALRVIVAELTVQRIGRQ